MLNARRDTTLSPVACPPGPRSGLLPERLSWVFRRNPLQFLSGLARDYGDIVLVPLGRRKVYFLNHPDFIRQVLVTDQASFSRGSAHLPSNPVVFDAGLDRPVEAQLRLLEALQPLYEPYSLAGVKPLVSAQVSLLTRSWRAGQLVDLPGELSRLVAGIAQAVFAGLAIPADLQARILAILRGGQVALAGVLASALISLAEHPDFEPQALSEIQSLPIGSDPASLDIQPLIYTRMFLAETLRMYPPVWLLSRQALCACCVGGYTIPAGSDIWLSPWVVQRDPRFFPNPGRFDPLRWSTSDNCWHDNYSFIPFGAGPRRCLGEGFAWLQGVLILALLLREWRFEPLPGRPLSPEALFVHAPKPVGPFVLKSR